MSVEGHMEDGSWLMGKFGDGVWKCEHGTWNSIRVHEIFWT